MTIYTSSARDYEKFHRKAVGMNELRIAKGSSRWRSHCHDKVVPEPGQVFDNGFRLDLVLFLTLKQTKHMQIF
jgi:hypothetical protein